MKKSNLFIGLLILLIANANAQPANNACAGAVTLTVGAGCQIGDVTGATTEGLSLPSCFSGNPSNYSTSVWYKFVATDDSITINFGDGTLGTQVLGAVFTSCAGTTELGCKKGGAEIDLTGLTVTNTYYIMVDGSGTNVGTFCISAYETPPPPPPMGTPLNPRTLYVAGDCNNIQGLQYDEQNNLLSTNTATGNDGGLPMGTTSTIEQSCAGTDVGQTAFWVDFTATATSANFANYGSIGYDYSVYAATSTDCSTLSAQVACVTAPAGDLTNSVSGLTSGTHYCVLITPAGTSTSSNAFLCITGTAYSNPYDACGSAAAITTGQNYVLNGSNASVDYNNTLCSGSTENNIWVKWTATFTGNAFVNLQNQDCACGNGMQMSIFNAKASCPGSSDACSIYINPNNDNDFYGQFSAVSGSTYYVQLDGYAGCGCTFDFCITNSNSTSCAALLPVDIYSFIGKNFENINILTWQTASEKNLQEFVIERSEDGINFSGIGSRPAAGQSTKTINYLFNDINIQKSNLYYYRLRKVDFNGVFSYSNIISVTTGLHQYLLEPVKPNPFKNEFTFKYFSDDTKILEVGIYNNVGSKIFSKKVTAEKGINQFQLTDTDIQLAPGVYFLRAVIDENIITNTKLVKF